MRTVNAFHSPQCLTTALFDSSDVRSAELLLLFERIAAEESWRAQGQLRAYTNASKYAAAYQGAELVGGIQYVLGGTGEMLPCVTVWPELTQSFACKSDVADIALLAISSEHRGNIDAVLWPLCVALFHGCHQAGVREIIAEVPPFRLRHYLRIGLPFKIMGDLKPHWGEPCYPVALLISEAESAICDRAVASTRYRRILSQAYHSRSAPKEPGPRGDTR